MIRRFVLALGLLGLAMLAFPAEAFADGGVHADTPTAVFPITLGALLAWGISSVVIPYVTAFVTAENAPPFVASLVTAVLAGLTALGAYLADVPGIPDWKYALGLFVSVVTGAVVYRKGIAPTGHTEHGTPDSLYSRQRDGILSKTPQLGARAA